MLMDFFTLLSAQNTELYQSGESLLWYVRGFGILIFLAAVTIGSFILMGGGARGRMMSVGWFLGAVAGLLILLGANDIAEGIQNQTQFSGN